MPLHGATSFTLTAAIRVLLLAGLAVFAVEILLPALLALAAAPFR